MWDTNLSDLLGDALEDSLVYVEVEDAGLGLPRALLLQDGKVEKHFHVEDAALDVHCRDTAADTGSRLLLRPLDLGKNFE